MEARGVAATVRLTGAAAAATGAKAAAEARARALVMGGAAWDVVLVDARVATREAGRGARATLGAGSVGAFLVAADERGRGRALAEVTVAEDTIGRGARARTGGLEEVEELKGLRARLELVGAVSGFRAVVDADPAAPSRFGGKALLATGGAAAGERVVVVALCVESLSALDKCRADRFRRESARLDTLKYVEWLHKLDCGVRSVDGWIQAEASHVTRALVFDAAD